MGELVADAPQLKTALQAHYNQAILSKVEEKFANLPIGSINYFPDSPEGYDVPLKHESPNWVDKTTVTFDTAWPDKLDDLNGTIGRGRLLSHKARYKIVKRINNDTGHIYYTALEVQSWGEMTDLYDFNYEAGGKARDAAILQFGFGNGKQPRSNGSGQIFRTRVHFNKTHVWSK